MSSNPKTKKQQDDTQEDTASIVRAPGTGMDPKSILIGDRLRHTVHNGALKMPTSVLALMAKNQVLPDEEGEPIELPSVDSVIRPTLCKEPITVTYLREEKGFMVPPGQPEGTPQVPFVRTVAVNQLWNPPVVIPEADRLRGGGVEDEAQKPSVSTAPSSQSAVATPASATPASATPASATPASATPASATPASATPASATPASATPNAAPAIAAPAIAAPAIAAPTIPAPRAPAPTATVPATPALVTTSSTPAAAPKTSAPGPTASSSTAPISVAPVSTAPTAQASIVAAPATIAPAAVAPVHPAPTAPTLTPQPTITPQPAQKAAAPAAPTPVPTPATPQAQLAAQPTVAPATSKPATQQTAPPATVPSSLPKPSIAPTAKPVVSATPATAATPAPAAPVARPVVGLTKTPAAQYEQHIPGPNDEMQVEIKNSRPPWYSSVRVSEIERTLLPEWFDESAQHRSKASYIKAREHVLKMSTQLGNRFITTALIRRTLPGDAGSLNRLHHFLMSYGLINADAINDSTPTTFALRDNKKRPRTSKFQDKLSEVVLKKHKENPTIDWQSVADEVGDGATATDCQKGFLAIDLAVVHPSTTAERSITPEPTDKGNEKPATGSLQIEQLLANTDEKILISTVEAALKQTVDLGQARSAAVTALLASQATQKARAEEEALGHVLAELNEKRMQRLEKRIELLNDVEGMMEAERMALELERRDLYTARCRHWFGGSS